MLILLFIIGLVMLLMGLVMSYSRFFRKNELEGIGDSLWIAGGIGSVIIFLIMMGVMVGAARLNVIDEKIAMYEEENKVIVEQMNVLVERYMDYESDTLKEFSDKNSIALVSMYPELKSDTLVQKQLDTYVQNNNQIKSFKEQKIDRSIYRWWLYFGK